MMQKALSFIVGVTSTVFYIPFNCNICQGCNKKLLISDTWFWLKKWYEISLFLFTFILAGEQVCAVRVLTVTPWLSVTIRNQFILTTFLRADSSPVHHSHRQYPLWRCSVVTLGNSPSSSSAIERKFERERARADHHQSKQAPPGSEQQQQSRPGYLHTMRVLPLTGIIAFIFCPVSTEYWVAPQNLPTNRRE